MTTPAHCRPIAAAFLAALAGLSSLAALAAPAKPVRRAMAPPVPGQTVAYNRDVRPVLSENCFPCHGPDSAARKANLRLDLRDVALTRGVIVPGKPEKSRLVARIFAAQPAVAMPPVASHERLTAEQKALLRRWIAEGARYEPHWAFVPLPAQVPVPSVPASWTTPIVIVRKAEHGTPSTPSTLPSSPRDWVKNPIDAFVLARLLREGLRPSPEATRADWLRRVTFDLTGLPPTPAEADAFLADTSADAYEKVVDRLLASPHYGERMAVPWLDVARYADSYGYQSDQLSPTWPYRDWVVNAFNDNLPYDRFLTWQLAGDLLGEEMGKRGNEEMVRKGSPSSGISPSPHFPISSGDAVVATAFNRLHRMTNEGGSVPEEWRLEGVADRVNTVGTAYLGLTLECARCHDHKFDPVTQREYYALSAFFNSIDEHGLYDRADIVPTPSVLLPTPEQARELDAARAAVAQAEAALAKARQERESAFRAWLAQPHEPALPDQTGRFDFEAFEGTTLRNQVPGTREHGARLDEVPLVEGHTGKAIQLDGENNVNFPQLGRFPRQQPFTIAFRMRDARQAAEPAVVFQACSGTDTGPHGYDLLLEQGRLTARLFRHWPGNAIAVRTRDSVPKDTWAHVAVTCDGSSRAAGLRIFLDGKPAETDVLRDRLYKNIGEHTLTFGQRFRDRGFKGGRIDELAIFTRGLTPLEVAQLADGRSLAAALAEPARNEAALREYYFSAVDPATRQAAAALGMARGKLVAAEDAPFELAVMEELPKPRPAYVLERGRYDAPRTDANRVERGTPAALPSFPTELSRDRLGLAQWLTRPDHPLTARVAVNRLWSLLFGRGLVETSENFGLQGQLPSHPELLDWLAVRFARGNEEMEKWGNEEMGKWGNVRSGPISPFPHFPISSRPWDVKALLRLIILSATYRQASGGNAALQERDPANVLLARGPSHRLSAEAIRDLALAASGLLDPRLGGPPVSPYQPADLWREANVMSPPYRQSVGRDLYRRSLYTVWKRTAPMPDLTAFDAVSREVCVARRQTTNTPLQALVLLNDPQFVEAARVLGERTLKEGGETASEQARFAFRLLATREPSTAEWQLLLTFYEGQRALFEKQPAEAAKLLAIGERKPDPALRPAEVAAAAMLAQAIMNQDAVVWKR